MTSGPKLLPGDMSGSLTLQQPGSVLMSMVSVTTEDHADDWSLVRHLSPCWYQRTLLTLGPCSSGWPVLPIRTTVTSKPKLQLRVMSGSMAPGQSESVLVSVAPDVIDSHTDVRSLGYLLRFCGSEGHTATGAVLIWEAYAAIRAMVTSRPKLLL